MIKDTYGNPRFYGVYRGVVKDTNDPLGKFRVKLQVPQVLSGAVTEWAWPIVSVSNTTVSVPAVGEGVFVVFEGGDPSFPLWSGKFTGSTEIVAQTFPEDKPFTVRGGSTGTQPTFSSEPLFTGSYSKNGSLVHFQIQVDMDNITNFGTGQYYVDLPFSAKHNYYLRDGCVHDISTDKQYSIGGHVSSGSKQLLLRSTSSNGNDVPFEHNVPFNLNAADNFHIAGTYITSE
jgi:hypothetical protein